MNFAVIDIAVTFMDADVEVTDFFLNDVAVLEIIDPEIEEIVVLAGLVLMMLK